MAGENVPRPGVNKSDKRSGVFVNNQIVLSYSVLNDPVPSISFKACL